MIMQNRSKYGGMGGVPYISRFLKSLIMLHNTLNDQLKMNLI